MGVTIGVLGRRITGRRCIQENLDLTTVRGDTVHIIAMLMTVGNADSTDKTGSGKNGQKEPHGAKYISRSKGSHERPSGLALYTHNQARAHKMFISAAHKVSQLKAT